MLSTNLKQKMQQARVSAAELERRIKTPYVVNNILNGKSKNPSAITTSAIARELNCSIEDLLQKPKAHRSDSINKPLDYKLLAETLNFLKDHNDTANLSLEEVLDILRSGYDYSTKEEPIVFSGKFINWLIEQKSKSL